MPRPSFATGGYEPQLTVWRLRLLLELWPELGPTDHVTFVRQVQHLWRGDPEAHVRLGADRKAHRLIRAALRATGETAAFDARRAQGPPQRPL